MHGLSFEARAHDAGGTVNNRSALGAYMGTRNVLCFAFSGGRRAFHTLASSWRAQVKSLLCVTAFLSSASLAVAQTTPPGTVIENTAHVSYIDLAGSPVSVATNSVSTTTMASPSLSSISLLRASSSGGLSSTAGPTQCRRSGGLTTLPQPMLPDGTTLDAFQAITLGEAATLHGGEPVFVRLQDADQNRDAGSIDHVELRVTSPSGDSEVLQLSETAPDSGIFIGYIQTSVRASVVENCTLEVDRNSEVSSMYIDPTDGNDTSRASALVDPYGLIFDSRTGEPIDGARVRLVEAASGAPAVVYGDDGVSRYPAEMVTGEAVTDAGGTLYTLPSGVFRFPLIAAGRYRIEVDPPAGHVFPSSLSMGELAQTPGAPYRLQPGSFGEAFSAGDAPIIAVDIPIDAAATQLFVQKSAMTNVAAIGDFVQYSLIVENTATNATVPSVRTIDSLPLGARYRSGSARVEGERIGDPEISPDGRELTFVTAALPPRQRIEIRYVVEITAGARGKQLVNSARAIGPDGVASNTAQATIQLREELFRERAIVMGRVVEGDCNAPAETLAGVAGVRVYLEDGRYSITDTEGKYHFEDVPPGSHVVQVDTITVPESHLMQECHQGVRHAGRSYSQFIDVRGGALWRSDFRLQRKVAPTGTFDLQLATARKQDRLQHTATLSTSKVGVSNARVMIMMPEGLRYRRGSSALQAASVADPSETSGILTFNIGSVSADAVSVLQFETEAGPNSSGALAIKAVAMADSPVRQGLRTAPIDNVILRGEMLHETGSYRFSPRFDVLDTTIQPEDREQLDKIIEEWRDLTNLRLTAVGHTDNTLIASNVRTKHPDNEALSVARAKAVADYLAARLQIDPANVTIEGRGAREPLAAGRDAKSLAMNRRVDLTIEGLRVVAAGGLTLKRDAARSEKVELVGALALTSSTSYVAPVPRQAVAASTAIDLESLQPGTKWLTPGAEDIASIPALKIEIQHAPAHRVELIANGSPVSPLNFDGVSANSAKSVSVSLWRGVELRDGENQIVAVVRDEQGAEVERLVRTIRYGGGAVRAEIDRRASTLLADGRTHPVIALRMLDASGHAARPGTTGVYSVEAPYRSWWEVEALHENKLVSVGTRRPTFTVDPDGLARLVLEPTTQAGTAVIRVRLSERQEQEIRVWLEPAARDWILVGIAEGTSAHKYVSDNMQSARDAGLDEGYAQDGRVAFFAKGAIKGEYLLTAAYDSAREHDLEKDRLLGAVEPDRFYTLYGDATEQRFEAASARKLFLKLERRQFAALFGDFETGMTVTELSRYSRTFTGFKSDYAGDRFGYTAFAAESEQGYVKDELQGDGTSGLYRLSRRPLILNTDKIRIEVRDRIRTEVIVQTRELTRHIDYSIDYLNGTLFFKQPVASRDANFNPVFIIAEYEVLNGGEAQMTAGGRASVKFANERVEIGGTFLREGATAGDSQITGTDLRWQIGAATELRAELARSDSDDPSRGESANAYMTELKHVGENLDARVYVREQESGFGVGQQLSLDTGSRKAGVDGRYRLTDEIALLAETFKQEMLDTGAERELVSAEVRYDADDYTAGVGARHVADAGLSTGKTESQQAFVNGSVDLFKDVITLRASQDLALGGKNGSVDFPNRSLVGVDYRWRPETTLFAEFEHADGELFDADMTRIGVRSAPWRRAQLQSSLNQQATEYGPRVFANVGLTQGWQLNERWGFDAGIDQSKTVSEAGVVPFNENVPLSSGAMSGDFVATFLGALYRSDLWTFTSRLEHRDSDAEDRWIASGGFYREPIAGHAFSLATQWFDNAFSNGSDATAADVQLAWAYRPATSAWIVLNRLDLKHEARSDSLGEFESARVINNLNSSWQLDVRTQLGVQFGTRYVRSTFDGERYSGLSTLYGLDMRRDLSDRFDVGIHGTMLSSLQSNVSDRALGVDFGITVARNTWVSIGYNFTGFEDDDFEASRYTAQGPFIKFRMKADQDTFKDILGIGTRAR